MARPGGTRRPRRVPPRTARDFFLAALPAPGDDGGCLLAVSERPGGFDADDRGAWSWSPRPSPSPPRPRPTEGGELPANAFSLAMDTGRVEVGDDILALFGLGPDAFDGKVETLLGLTVPEDLPSLMSVVEADHMSLGDRELEFRVLQPSGPPKWLRLRGRLLPGGEGRPARLVGTVADASTLRAEVTDVARVQRLAAALATAGTVRDVSQAVVTALRKPLRADRIALAELENDRLVVTVLDPPEPESWPELWRAGMAHRVARRARARHAHPRRRAARGPRPDLARRQPPWNRPSPTSAPAAWPSCRCPPGAAWPAPV